METAARHDTAGGRTLAAEMTSNGDAALEVPALHAGGEEHRRAAAADRIGFETLISDTSARLMAAPPDAIAPAVDAALTQVMRFFRADRCGLLSGGDQLRRVHILHAAYSEGVPQVAGDVDLDLLFPWTRDRLLVERAPVGVPRMDDLPAEAAVDRANWALMGTRSVLTVPIFEGPAISHLVVIHTVNEEREFPPAIVPRLRVLGELMVSALQRKEAFDALRASEERLSLSAAAAGCGLWELDVRTERFWVTSETRRMYVAGQAALVRRGPLVHVAEAVHVRVDAAQQDGPRGRAAGVRVEAGEAHALLG